MSNRGRIPDWLYQPLPYLYVAMGGLTLYTLPNAVGMASGAMLVSAGFIVWNLRRRYRRYQELPSPGRREPDAGDGKLRYGLVRLIWRPEYECGHPLIDIQHRKLFELGNALLNAILEDQAKLDVELLLDELIAHVETHFCDEEALLARSSHPISREHRELHHALLARAKALSKSYHQGGMTVGELFTFISNDVVAQHIIKEDLSFLHQAV